MTPANDRFDYGPLSAAQVDDLCAKATMMRSRAGTMTPAIIDIGRNLLVAKQTLPHGRFLPWVKAECGFAPRTAQNYMRVAEFADGKCETVSLLTPTAIYALSSKKAPPVVVYQVLQLLESNQVPTECDVLRMLAEAREPKAERSQPSGLNAQVADDLASRLLGTIGRDLARSLAEGPWDQIGVALREKLAGVASSSDQCRAAADVAPTSTHVDPERDPHDANLYRPKTSESDNGGIPPFLDRRLWASGRSFS
jgi:Protein of unknown function (DUF3102)